MRICVRRFDITGTRPLLAQTGQPARGFRRSLDDRNWPI